MRRLPIAAYFTPRHQDCRVARPQLRMRFLVAQGSASPCRGRPPWLPIRFERGHVVAPGTALGTCPRSCPVWDRRLRGTFVLVILRCETTRPAWAFRKPQVSTLESASRIHRVPSGTRKNGIRAACELSPAGTKENSPGFQPGDSRRTQIESRRDDRVRTISQMHPGSHSLPSRLRNVNYPA